MRQRSLSVTAAMSALGMTIALAGCGSTGDSGDVTLKLVAAEYGSSAANSTERYWLAMVAEFESRNPGIKIDIDIRPLKTIDSDVAQMVKDGKAPDIAQVGSYADYAKSGKLYTADEVLSVPTQANFLTQLTEAGTVNRIQYGVPFTASTRLLLYNKKFFRKAGLGAPADWADIKGAAQALKEQGVTTPLALPLGSEEAQTETLMWLLSGDGGYTDTADGSYSLDSSQNVKTFSWLKGLVGEGLTGPIAPKNLDRATAFQAFTSGEVGMLNGNPSLLVAAQDRGIDVGSVPLPGVEGKAESSMGVSDWAVAFKQNDHQNEITKFMDFTFDDQNVLTFVGNYDQLPVTYTANERMSANRAYRNLTKFQTPLNNSEFFPYDKTSWSIVSESIRKNIGQAVEPGSSPAGVLGGIARDADSAESAESAE